MGNISDIKTNTIYNSIKTIATVLMPIIVSAYTLRVLGPEYMGKIGFVYNLVSYFAIFASLGISSYAIRECAARRNNKDELRKFSEQIYTIGIIAALVAYILLAIVVIVGFKVFEPYLFLIVVQSISIIATALGTEWFVSAMEEFKYISIVSICLQIMSLVMIVIFVKKPEDYYRYVVIGVVVNICTCAFYIIKRNQYSLLRITRRPEISRHLRPILSMLIMLMSQQIFSVCDVVIIGIFRGDVEVGLYNTSYNVCNMAAQFIASVIWVIFPKVSVGAIKEDYKSLRVIVKFVVEFTAMFGMIAFVSIYFYAKEILLVLGGREYIVAYSIVRVLSINVLIMLINNVLVNMFLLAKGEYGTCAKVCFVAAMVNVIANIMFIPQYGMLAACFTTMLSNIIITIASIRYVGDNLRIKNVVLWCKNYFVIGIFVGIFDVLVLVYSDNLLIRVLGAIIGVVLYFSLLLLKKDDLIYYFIAKNDLLENDYEGKNQ